MDASTVLINAGAAGIVIGATLTAAGFLYRNRLQNLAVKKECLYQLLELARSMRVASSMQDKSDLDLYFEVVEEELNGTLPIEEKAKAKEVVASLIDQSFGIVAGQDHGDLEAGFQRAVVKLSPISPILAARINSNVKVRAVLPAMDKYFECVNAHPEIRFSPQESKAIKELASTYKLRLMSDAIESLRIDTLHVALRCGVIEFIQVYLQSQTKARVEIDKYRKEEMRALFKEAMRIYEKHAAET